MTYQVKKLFSDHENQLCWLSIAGWASLLVYSFFWLISSSIAKPAEILFMACFLGVFFLTKKKNTSYVFYFWLMVAFLFVQIISHYQAPGFFPAISNNNIRHDRHYSKLFLCVLAAYWIKGSARGTYYLIMTAVVGFLVSLLFKSSLSEWQMGLSGKRIGFDYVNIQHTAVFFGLSLIACVFGVLSGLSRKKTVEVIICFFGSVVFFLGIVITQTRAVWLGLVVVILVMMVLAFLNMLKSQKSIDQRKFIALLIIPMVFFLPFKSVFEERVLSEKNTIYALLKGDRDQIILDSAGARVYMWSYAVEKIKEKPLLGWGAESRRYLLDNDSLPKKLDGKHVHFHNSYLDLIVAYGLIGFFIIAILVVKSIAGCFSLINKGYFYLGAGLFCSWIFFLIVNFFESYIIFSTARFFFFICGGASLSHYIYKK